MIVFCIHFYSNLNLVYIGILKSFYMVLFCTEKNENDEIIYKVFILIHKSTFFIQYLFLKQIR